MSFTIGCLVNLKLAKRLDRLLLVTRPFSSTSTLNGVSNPFRPKKETSNKDITDFMAEKSKSSNINKINIIKKESVLGNIFQSLFNPKPLNTILKEKFGLDDSYKLVYIIPNERNILIINVVGFFISLIVAALIPFIIVAELTGRAKLSESFESPLAFLTFFFLWASTVFVATVRFRKSNVTRIYYKQAENRYTLIRPKGIVSFCKEDFQSKDFVYRNDPSSKSFKSLINSLVNNFSGNVYINKQLRHIDFGQFISNKIIEDLVGKEQLNRMKREPFS